VIPFHTKNLKRGTLRGIIEQAGLSVEEFVALL
jgi:predicted RNA binding protein YcfA (HicA-like mRNA interferase family)